MILALPTYVNCKDMILFEGQENIIYNEDSKLTIDDPLPGRYNISWREDANNLFQEAWVTSLDEKIDLVRTGFKGKIIIMPEDGVLLPYCTKDRIVYLQDQLNKGKLNV